MKGEEASGMGRERDIYAKTYLECRFRTSALLMAALQSAVGAVA